MALLALLSALIMVLQVTLHTSTEHGRVGDDIMRNCSLLHRRQKTQGLMPLLALLTSLDNGTVGNNVGQSRSLQHHRQSIQSLLPMLANPTSTDDG